MKIFISYSKYDRPKADSLAEDLRNVGYEVWYDQKLHAGLDWWETILDQIQVADLFIYLLSPTWLSSKASQSEFEWARALRKHTLPLKIKPLDTTVKALPDYIQGIQILDYQKQDKGSFQQIIKAINLLPPHAPIPNPLPPKPPRPVSELNKYYTHIKSTSLSDLEQKVLVQELIPYLKNADEKDVAKELLTLLRNRGDVLASVRTDIDRALSGGTIPTPLTGNVNVQTAWLELIGLAGFLGVGYLSAGKTQEGIMRMVIFLGMLAIGWIMTLILGALSGGILFCILIPAMFAIQVGVPIWSALQLQKELA